MVYITSLSCEKVEMLPASSVQLPRPVPLTNSLLLAPPPAQGAPASDETVVETVRGAPASENERKELGTWICTDMKPNTTLSGEHQSDAAWGADGFPHIPMSVRSMKRTKDQ